MDPSRNMGKYRSLLAQSQGQTPMIPFYPVVKKVGQCHFKNVPWVNITLK